MNFICRRFGTLCSIFISGVKTRPIKMEEIENTETSAHKIHTPGNHQKVIQQMRFYLLKPTGHVMHHQFNIQQLYALPTLYLCVLDLSENTQRLVPLTA